MDIKPLVVGGEEQSDNQKIPVNLPSTTTYPCYGLEAYCIPPYRRCFSQWRFPHRLQEFNRMPPTVIAESVRNEIYRSIEFSTYWHLKGNGASQTESS